MINSNLNHNEAFVWIWLPNTSKPIVAGKLEVNGQHHDFFYGQSYLENPNAIALSSSEIPLVRGKRFTSQYDIHAVIKDALPDSWGRRVLYHRHQTTSLSVLDMLLLSSSDRIGALHFQETSTQFEPCYENHASLEQLLEAANLIEQGQPVPKELEIALLHGTSIGGARPKALIEETNKKYIAKFSSSSDLFPIVQAEFATMWLAEKIGLHATPVKLVQIKGKFVLLIERFDRTRVNNDDWQRKFMVSGLTLLGLDESEGRYASYLDMADQIRRHNREPINDLHELFRRMVFNILVGNTDDHAKNHAFFWDGHYFELTPAYDVCPFPRVGQETTQAMIVGKHDAFSQLSNALSAAPWFQLSEQETKEEINRLVENVKSHWPEACEKAKLTKQQKDQLTGSAILNPYCFYETKGLL